jgi:signal transduction histidine kinase
VLESVLDESEKLRKLTNGLLNLAQSNIDFASMKKEEIRLDEMLIDLRAQLKVKRPGSSLELKFPQMPDHASSLVVMGETHLLEMALLNLLDNACKFSDGKPVTASLLLERNTISVKIADQGIGINQSEMEYLTETFYRAENARTYPGSGIGLTLAEKIISLHGGMLTLESELGKGTVVTATFNKM